jgi:arylsulfatase A-like enzyme
MPDEYLNMYDVDDIKLPENFAPEHPIKIGTENDRDECLEAYPRTPQEIKKHIREYYAMITHLDAGIGRVIDALEKKGELDNTIIVFTGDNGLAVGQHGLMGKSSFYEHSVRVPLIFSGPGIQEDKKASAYTYLFDIFPTLCDLTGIEIPETVEGKSLLHVLNDTEEKHRTEMYFAFTDLIRGMKNERYKYIEYSMMSGNKAQIFDIVNDPLEMDNLAEKREYNDLKNEMRTRLIEIRDEWDDLKHWMGASYWGHKWML